MLGNGAFSIVRQVRCRETGKSYAAKSIQTISESWYQRGTVNSEGEPELKNGKFSTCRTLEEVRQECQLLYQLKDHISVVDIIDSHIEAGKVTIVMEILKGGSIAHAVSKREGGMSEKTLKRVFQHLMYGLDKLHEANIIHRDLKLENLMLGDSKDPASLKIIDFGLATKCHPGCSHFLDSNLKGTVTYLAPEIALQRRPVVVYEQANDMWACGIALLTALTGTRCPFAPGSDTPWWDKTKSKQKHWLHAISAPSLVALEDVSATDSTASPKEPSVLVMDPAVQKELQAYVNKKVDQWLATSRHKVSIELKAFIKKLMQVDPRQRITASAALADSWICGIPFSMASGGPGPWGSKSSYGRSSPKWITNHEFAPQKGEEDMIAPVQGTWCSLKACFGLQCSEHPSASHPALVH